MVFLFYDFSATCSPLDTLASGSVNYTDVPTTNGKYLAGTMATFFCEDGAKLTGDNTSTCQDDHTWTVTNISCEGVFYPVIYLFIVPIII